MTSRLMSVLVMAVVSAACGSSLDAPTSTPSQASTVPSTPSTTSPVSTSTTVGVDGFCEGIALTDELAFEASLPVDTIAVTVVIAGDGPLGDRAREALVEATDELEAIGAEIDSSYAGLAVSDPDLAKEVESVRSMVAAQFEFLVSSVRGAKTGAEVNTALAAAFDGGDQPEDLASLVVAGGSALSVINQIAGDRCGIVIDGQ